MRKILVGLVEPVKIKVQKGFIEILGKFDTGAKRTSIDKNLASKIKLKRVGEIPTKSVHRLGRDAIFPNFIIDITKSHKSHRLRDIK